MSTSEIPSTVESAGPRRADARRNRERILVAAREAFAEGGESTALEQIARRAGVGIGTLYRHFPNRQVLLEALYVNEVEEVCRSADELSAEEPWQALNDWFDRLIGYLITKRALAHELTDYLDPSAPLFSNCRTALFGAGAPLLERAQDAEVVRSDVDFSDVLQMVAAISKIPATEPGQIEHVLRVALDGLRYQPA
jgi:AcrR family transcriptional regulator